MTILVNESVHDIPGQGHSPVPPQIILWRRWVNGVTFQSRSFLCIVRTHVLQPVHIHRVVQGPQATSHNSHSGVHHFETSHRQSSTQQETIWDKCGVAALALLYPLPYPPTKIHGISTEGGGGYPHPLRVTWDFDLVTWTITSSIKEIPCSQFHFARDTPHPLWVDLITRASSIKEIPFPLVHPRLVFVIKKNLLPNIPCGVTSCVTVGRGYGNPALDGPNEHNFDGANECTLLW